MTHEVTLLGEAGTRSGVGKYLRMVENGIPAPWEIHTVSTDDAAGGETEASTPTGDAVVEAQRRQPGASLRLLAGYLRETLWVWRRIRRNIRKGGIVHVNRMGCEVDAIAARLAGAGRIAATLHVLPGGDEAARFWVRRTVEWVSLRCADRLIAISEAVALEWGCRVNLGADRFQVIYNGVPVVARAKGPSGNGKGLTIGSTGRLHPLKGMDTLIQAFALLPRVWRDQTRLILFGEGPMRHPLERLVAELGLAERVEFRGHVEDVTPELSCFDLFVSASRYEGMSLSLAEAMMAGLPCVVTDSGGMSELIRKSGGGLIVPIEHVRLLARAMEIYLKDDLRRKRDGAAGREFALKALSTESMCHQTAAIYADLAS